MVTGINISKILNFFMLLCCAFPSCRTIYYAVRYVVRPIVYCYYTSEQNKIIDCIVQSGHEVHLSADGQYDSPGFCAYNCTVTALEKVSKKIIGFMIVNRREANNRSACAKPIAFWRLFNELLKMNVRITSVTTDASPSLNSLFANEFLQIKHYYNLWQILRNMYRQFLPKFINVCFIIFLMLFLIIFIFSVI